MYYYWRTGPVKDVGGARDSSFFPLSPRAPCFCLRFPLRISVKATVSPTMFCTRASATIEVRLRQLILGRYARKITRKKKRKKQPTTSYRDDYDAAYQCVVKIGAATDGAAVWAGRTRTPPPTGGGQRSIIYEHGERGRSDCRPLARRRAVRLVRVRRNESDTREKTVGRTGHAPFLFSYDATT